MTGDSQSQASPFERWLQEQDAPVVGGYSVPDVLTLPLGPWERKGGLGAILNLVGCQGWMNAYVCEIPTGQALKPQRHLFEEEIYVLRGQGVTEVWDDGGGMARVEWKEGSLFSPPLNVWHRHANLGDGPARYLAVTTLPVVMNLFRNPDFVFDNGSIFRDRFDGKSDYFRRAGRPSPDSAGHLAVNLISNVREVAFQEWAEGLPPGAANPMSPLMGSIYFCLSRNTLVGHIREIKPGTYKKAHRHGGAAHILILAGSGYSLMWPVGGERVRVDWKPGSVFSPPERWFHQHFNTGRETV
ncbi:MAG: cupin domain-containing protein, partial [Dehalococcoidia bacterium]|nr:cupin domain-containing protein [Dehalococcoidia bacterium]